MKKFLMSAGLLSSIFVVGACDNANGKALSGNGSLSEKDVQKIVAQYIDENPEALIASLEKFQEREVLRMQEEAKNAVKKNRLRMLESPHSGKFGDLDGDNYIVEFFDYNCGYCKRTLPTIEKLIQTQKNTKIVLIEFPVLGPSSDLASAAAIVVQMKHPSKYLEFHAAMMKHNGKKDLSAINQIARDLDIRDVKFAEEVRDPAVLAALDENRAIASDLGIRGTPAFIVNDELIAGAVPYENIVQVLEQTKK